jgi:hypothetical protein
MRSASPPADLDRRRGARRARPRGRASLTVDISAVNTDPSTRRASSSCSPTSTANARSRARTRATDAFSFAFPTVACGGDATFYRPRVEHGRRRPSRSPAAGAVRGGGHQRARGRVQRRLPDQPGLVDRRERGRRRVGAGRARRRGPGRPARRLRRLGRLLPDRQQTPRTAATAMSTTATPRSPAPCSISRAAPASSTPTGSTTSAGGPLNNDALTVEISFNGGVLDASPPLRDRAGRVARGHGSRSTRRRARPTAACGSPSPTSTRRTSSRRASTRSASRVSSARTRSPRAWPISPSRSACSTCRHRRVRRGVHTQDPVADLAEPFGVSTSPIIGVHAGVRRGLPVRSVPLEMRRDRRIAGPGGADPPAGEATRGLAMRSAAGPASVPAKPKGSSMRFQLCGSRSFRRGRRGGGPPRVGGRALGGGRSSA